MEKDQGLKKEGAEPIPGGGDILGRISEREKRDRSAAETSFDISKRNQNTRHHPIKKNLTWGLTKQKKPYIGACVARENRGGTRGCGWTAEERSKQKKASLSKRGVYENLSKVQKHETQGGVECEKKNGFEQNLEDGRGPVGGKVGPSPERERGEK